MNIINNNLSVSTVSATTYYNLPGFQTTVEVATIVYQSPKEIITIINRPLPTPSSPPVVYVQRTQVVTPPPIHKTIVIGALDIEEMCNRICGGPGGINSKEINCKVCVRAYGAAHPNAGKGDYTQRNTGCSLK